MSFCALSQEDIDTALCAWNGNIESKHAVVRYMKDHAREKDTAAWLAQEYGGSNSLFVVRAGSPEETQLPWLKVQRRLAQLIQEDRFYTEEEQDRLTTSTPSPSGKPWRKEGSSTARWQTRKNWTMTRLSNR